MRYVGSVLSKILVDTGYEVKSCDSGLFEKNFLKKPFDNYETITNIRELNQDDKILMHLSSTKPI